MFNMESRARLTEFAPLFDRIEREAEFFTVGKLPTRAHAKLAPVNHERHLPELLRSLDKIAAVICPEALVDKIPSELGCAVSEDPAGAAYQVHVQLCERPDHFWSSFPSRIAESARIHPRAYVAPHDVVIGENTVVGPNASILERSIIGSDCFIGAGTVIGSEAFEMVKVNGQNRLQTQAGGVLVGDRVVFLSNDTVARSVFPVFTEIGDECGFDNLVHVAHDCVLGAGSKLTACSMLAGRVVLGERAYLGPNATVSNGVEMGDDAYATIGSTVVRNVAAGAKVTGNFAIDHQRFIQNLKASVR